MPTKRGRAHQKSGGEKGHGALRNQSKHAGRKASHKLEQVASGRPSRKSTRGGANHQRPDNAKQLQQTNEVRSPSARSESKGG